MSVFIIAELGINHNGDVAIAKKLIDGAIFAGANAVKFQKRTVEKVYTKEELDKPRESPWGTTVREQKNGLEFSGQEYDEIDRYCKEKNIEWFASAWDIDSLVFLGKYNLTYNKIASALLTYKDFVQMVARQKKHTFISTGMSTLEEIGKVVDVFKKNQCPFELMHCSSAYPMTPEEANLKMIGVLRETFQCDVGYSGHEVGLNVSYAAVALGATSIERHITLDRAMYGSDQAASVEVIGFHKLIRDIRSIERALGDGVKRISRKEEEVKKKLRKFDNF